jgi:hypothetical protein
LLTGGGETRDDVGVIGVGVTCFEVDVWDLRVEGSAIVVEERGVLMDLGARGRRLSGT